MTFFLQALALAAGVVGLLVIVVFALRVLRGDD